METTVLRTGDLGKGELSPVDPSKTNGLVQRDIVSVSRSDSACTGISMGSSTSDVGGAFEEMDTEDSERDARDSFMNSTWSSFSSQDGHPKQGVGRLNLVLDNLQNDGQSAMDVNGLTTGEMTSPVIENKLSDNLEGYYAMRTSLFSQSAVILENGAAVQEAGSTRLCCENDAFMNRNPAEEEEGKRLLSVPRSNDVTRNERNRNILIYQSDSEGEKLSGESNKTSHRMRTYDLQEKCASLGASDALYKKTDPQCNDGEDMQQNTEKGIFSLSKTGDNRNADTLLSTSSANIDTAVKGSGQVGHTSPDSSSKVPQLQTMSVKTAPVASGDVVDKKNCERLGLLKQDMSDSSECESMAEVEKFGLEAKLARVSKRRVYSRAKELNHEASSSDSDSDSDSDDEEEDDDERGALLGDLHGAKVLVNVAQPDSEKLIKQEVLKVSCADDIFSDYVSSEDSSEDSSDDSSSEESSDSDDSSDADLSSNNESDAEEERKERKAFNGRQSAPKEVLQQGLPKVEYLDIKLPDTVQLTHLGCVSSIIGSLVIIQADRGSPALNIDSVLFKADRSVLGQIFEIFGPVASPFYSVRFNAPADVSSHGVSLKGEVFYCPQNIDITEYVFTEQLRKLRGSDASWEDDKEVPDDSVDFSDDEAEAQAKSRLTANRRRKVPKGRVDNQTQGQGNKPGCFQGNERQHRAHPPLQRQHAIIPPCHAAPHNPFPHRRFGTPPVRHHLSGPPSSAPGNRPRGMWNSNAHSGASFSGGQYGGNRNPPRQWYGGYNQRPRFSQENSAAFQNPYTTAPPQSSSQAPAWQQQSLQQQQQQPMIPAWPPVSGFSARKTGVPPPWQKGAPQPPPPPPGLLPFSSPHIPQSSSSQTPPNGSASVLAWPPVSGFSARKSGVPPPWQKGAPQPPPPPPGLLPFTSPLIPQSSSSQTPPNGSASVTQAVPPFASLPFNFPASLLKCPPPPPPPGSTSTPLPSETSGQANHQKPPVTQGAQTPPSSKAQNSPAAPSQANPWLSWLNPFMGTGVPPPYSFPPPSIPPPPFHPSMMQSVRGVSQPPPEAPGTQVSNSQGQ